MVERIEVGTCKTTLDEHREFLYRYFLTESTRKILLDEIEVCVPSYGIGIVREEILDGKRVDMYEDSYEYVSPFKDKVIYLIDYLIENEVSPLHLIDIIGESVDEWASDFENEAKNQLNIIVMA